MEFQHTPELHPDVTPDQQSLPTTNGAAPTVEVVNRHAEAGRKGAQRIHELIQQGKIYEKEHGLKRGRQRLRQLIQEGKLYEQEHGLRPVKARRTRQQPDQAVHALLQSIYFLAQPRYRDVLLRAIHGIKEEKLPDAPVE